MQLLCNFFFERIYVTYFNPITQRNKRMTIFLVQDKNESVVVTLNMLLKISYIEQNLFLQSYNPGK
jgi:hypothetical protein